METPALFLLTFLFAFLLCAGITAILIPRLCAMKMGQKILEIGPVWHAAKEGTPTMGGLAFLLTALLFGIPAYAILEKALPPSDIYPFILTWLFCIASGAVGIVDDATKLRRHRNEGLTPTQKIVLQTVLSAAYLAILRMMGKFSTIISLPFFGGLDLGFAAYFVGMILLLGITNCANLTDGIDGLAAAVGAVIFATYAVFAARRDDLPALLLAALLFGCALAFFLFNHHPARIFMGDTGSLFFGAGAVALPFLLQVPFLSLLCGIIYVVEGVSVILQVLYYKRTKKRLFLMAPIHHHFEKCGWSENKIVAVFSGITLLAALLAHFLS